MPILRGMTLGFLFTLALSCSACLGGKSEAPGDPSASSPSGDCEAAYTYAPAFYVINIAAGDAVVLDPLSQDFPLFCDPSEASKALQKELDAGRQPAGMQWHIYRVWGDWNEIAANGPDGGHILKRSAPLVDWIK